MLCELRKYGAVDNGKDSEDIRNQLRKPVKPGDLQTLFVNPRDELRSIGKWCRRL